MNDNSNIRNYTGIRDNKDAYYVEKFHTLLMKLFAFNSDYDMNPQVPNALFWEKINSCPVNELDKIRLIAAGGDADYANNNFNLVQFLELNDSVTHLEAEIALRSRINNLEAVEKAILIGIVNEILCKQFSDSQITTKPSQTDFKRTKELFDSLEIGYSLKEYTSSTNHKITQINCIEGEKKISGYSCFYTLFIFDSDGKFIEMGAYE